MFEINRDTLAALLAIAAKDDPREYLNAVYFYSDGTNAYAIAANGHFMARQTICDHDRHAPFFGVPVLALEVALFASKKAKTYSLSIRDSAIECGVSISFNRLYWPAGHDAMSLITPPRDAILGPNSGKYNPHYVAQISNLIGAADTWKRWCPVPICTDYQTGTGYVDTGKTKACIMGVRV